MGRGMQLAVLGAVIVGGVGGALAALAVAPAPDVRVPDGARARAGAAQVETPPAAATPVVVAPAVPPAVVPAAPDPQLAATTTITAVLTRFADWARDHAGEPCPEIAALGVIALDPWRRPIELTCSDQPADQMIGAVSAGPDGIAGNDDDIASWTLGRDVTDRVRGARWKPVKAAATRSRSTRQRKDAGTASGTIKRQGEAPPPVPATTSPEPPAPPPSAPPVPPEPPPGDDIPSRRSPR